MEALALAHDRHAGWTAPLPQQLDSSRTLVLAFGPSSLLDDPREVQQLRAALPHACLLGCSTAGEILEDRILDDSLVVAVARFDATDLEPASAPLRGIDDSYGAGERVARQLTAERRPRAILVFSSGVDVNGSELIRGINSVTQGRVIVSGGLAGDGDRFQRTWVLHEEGVARACVSAVGLYGERLQVGCGSRGGWDIFGPERVVTRSRGNVLYELDDKPALALYKQYLGERAAGLPATGLLFPLALRSGADPQHRVVRTILGVQEADQSIVFAGDVPVGGLVQLMRANFERLISGAADAAQQACGDALRSAPALAIAVSCVGRRLVLGERSEEEVEVVHSTLGGRTRLVGYYSYGEFSPQGLGGCDLHNQTMTLTTLAEE